MKKIFCIILCFILLTISFSGCKKEKIEKATEIYFYQTLPEIRKLNNKKVMIYGYMTMVAPEQEKSLYLVSTPLQTTPKYTPSSSPIVDKIAVQLNDNVEYTTEIVLIIGRLSIGDFKDICDNNYKVKITDAVVRKFSLDQAVGEYKTYHQLASDGEIPYQLYKIIQAVDCCVNYDKYNIKESEMTEKINFYNYEEIKEKVENYKNGDYKEFLHLWDTAYELTTIINKNIENGEPTKNMELKTQNRLLIKEFANYIQKFSV